MNMRILNVFKKKLVIRILAAVSVLLNVLLIFYIGSATASPARQIYTSSTPPYDKDDTVYLAHGAIAFKNKADQPKDTQQIITFYMDTETKTVYSEESVLMNNSILFMGRNKMDIVSFDPDSKILTLKGNGWEKVIIDGEKKRVMEATDTTGDVVYLKATWDIDR